MSSRNTSTGTVLENMVVPVLDRGHYTYSSQNIIGQRPGGRQHKVDLVVEKGGSTFLVSLKWQQVSGTAEQKVPFEVICLAEAVKNSEGQFKKAYLVLGGGGWTLREFYVGGGLQKHLSCADLVEILTLEDFVARANTDRL